MENKNPKPPIDRDDPRLTAYVLDEVTAEERATIEAAIAADPSLAEEIESIRQTVGLLETTLATEPLPEATVKVQPRKKWYQRRLPQLGVLAASACLLLVLILPALQSERQCARLLDVCLDDSNFRFIEGEPLPSEFFEAQQKAQAEMARSDQEASLDYGLASKKDQDASVPHNDSSPMVFPKTWGQLKHSRSQLKRQKAIVDALEQADDSFVAFNDKQPIVYPPAEVWEKMSERRKRKYSNMALAKDGVADTKTSTNFYSESDLGTKFSTGQQPEPPKQKSAYGAAAPAPQTPAYQPYMDGGMGKPLGSVSQELQQSSKGLPAVENKTSFDRGRHFARTSSDLKMKSTSGEVKQEREEVKAPFSFSVGISRGPVQLKARFDHNTEAYDQIVENEFLRTTEQPLSTFSIDVDTAGYSNLRRFLNNGSLPPKGSVRTEEMVNYFEYDYSPPTAEDKTPFAANMAVAACPWNEKHELVRIALKGRVVEEEKRPEMNLVFLLDVSGSMSDQNKLPLVKEGMTRLVRQLNAKDHVAIVVYAGASGLVLPSTAADESGKPKILAALDQLQSGGSTNGGQGIRLAYATAAQHFNSKGVNRVILCTDGDFNVGTTSQSELISLIEKKAKEDVFLTVLGFGCGNYKDSTLEKLADKGNGNYGYIDNQAEAEKLLVRQLLGTLVTIAKDVKIQVEFNPTKVAAYRLLGYENRVMAKEDFNDDTKDAGEIGAGHTVTAFYELVPVGADESVTRPAVDPLKYQTDNKEPLAVQGEMSQNDEQPPKAVEESKAKTPEPPTTGRGSLEGGRGVLNNELLTLKLRYKEPTGDTSTKVEFPLVAPTKLPGFAEADSDFRFAGSVVGFAMLLRDSKFKGTANFKDLIDWAEAAQGSDPHGYRKEFLQLLRAARSLSNE